MKPRAPARLSSLPMPPNPNAARLSSLLAVAALFAGCAPAASIPAPPPPPAPAAHPVLVLTAVDFEFDAVASTLATRHEELLLGRSTSSGAIDGVPVVVVRAGWGKAQAAGATAAAIERYAPSAILMAGVGGAIDSARATSGDVVLVGESYQYDLGHVADGGFGRWTPETPHETDYAPKTRFPSAALLLERASAALGGLALAPWSVLDGCTCDNHGTPKSGCVGTRVTVGRARPRVCVGAGATGDAFLEDRDAGGKLVDPDTAVVDMETAAVAEEAANAKLPFLGVRVVADSLSYDVYFCLKPAAGARLAEAMRRVLPAVGSSKTPDGASLAPCDARR
jgi:adenosylhomocysteine nucleosidase